jgi:hypothetical protein
MKLCKETLDVLKNFATINGGIVIEPGNLISTKHTGDHILGNYTAPEEFPVQVAFYDLNQFLGVVGVFSNPVFEFEESQVIISEESNSYLKNVVMYTDPTYITRSSKIKPPNFDAKFVVTDDILSRLDKLSSIQNLDQFVFEGTSDNEVFLKAINVKNPDSNNFSVLLGENDLKKPFKMIFNKESFLFLKGDYDVQISEKRVAHFKHKSIELEYFVMADSKSKF